jgi:hypothetical protein
LDGDVGSGGVVDKLIEPGTSLGDGNGCHTWSVRFSVRMSSWFFLGPTTEAHRWRPLRHAAIPIARRLAAIR